MAARLWRAMLARVDGAMATAGIVFMDAWGRLERGYRRPLARVALRLTFRFYPLLACAALGWLAWDWTHARSLDAAEDAIFDQVVRWRPVEPRLSGRTLIVEVDDCSIAHFRAAGDGGWPWSRQRHADLLDQLDRAGVSAVGYDVMFVHPSPYDPAGDAVLDAMAGGGAGRFVFASARLHPGFDATARLHAADAPGAFARVPGARAPGPRIALMLPYGEAMARHSGLANVSRNADGVLRDVALREPAGDWAVPSLPARVASRALGVPEASFPASLRINWRTRTRISYASAADVIEGEAICRPPGDPPPRLRDAVVLVGHTAAGIADVKPTPVDPAMPGVEVLAEATEALLAGSAIRMPPAALKYLLAAALVALTGFAFWRGEPHEDVDSVFVATNLVLLVTAAAGLTFFGTFIDIFAAVGFIGLFFGLCRTYAAVQRGRAIGNNDFLAEYDPGRHPWLVMARLRYVPDRSLDAAAATRRRREYRRRLRRFLYAGSDAVMIEGIVERKSWLHAILDDLMVLVWKGGDRAEALALARRDLDDLHAHLNPHDEPLDVDGMVRACVVAAAIGDGDDEDLRGECVRLRELLGQDLNLRDEWPLSPANTFSRLEDPANGALPCPTPPA